MLSQAVQSDMPEIREMLSDLPLDDLHRVKLRRFNRKHISQKNPSPILKWAVGIRPCRRFRQNELATSITSPAGRDINPSRLQSLICERKFSVAVRRLIRDQEESPAVIRRVAVLKRLHSKTSEIATPVLSNAIATPLHPYVGCIQLPASAIAQSVVSGTN